MRKRALIGGVLASVAVVLGSWEVGQPHTTTTTTTPAASGDDGGSSSGSSSSGSSSSGSTSSGSTSTATFTDGTFTGSTVSTQYGDVQVQVTVSGGKITAVTPLHLTDAEQRSVMISEQAAPLLEDEVLSAQSADVDTISGATYTSDAYLQSLQAALDQAR
ncbi:FMN-binding protein [Curtobacterium sp. MCBD17_034]|uniref:FMN-binding protein n=1 Tax=unclassified Curtobacterium TaxID=257496 RepID=UPI000DAA83FF|nr:MULTISPECIES: FMN-binding protein [unclassified Curtobacterium]PZF58669.1 FMN-binding protein [Curtobacterium sp. MCBD17_034]PZM34659.1 FMN-binding protein [Curtobacterium sp. MCBD17_031]